jgi:release factor glutamine methyltransferase
MRVSERIIQQSDAYIAKKLVRHIMGRSAEELVLAYDHVLTDIEFADLDALMKRCEIGEPLAYVLGYELFGGYHFAVDERVLIPRSETEELVQYVYDMVYDDSIIIDVGTGSGCVGISLALACGSNQRTYLLDISEDALQVAIHNMNYLAVDHDIIFSTSDMLDAVNGLAHTNQHRLVVSNAPYIPHAYD